MATFFSLCTSSSSSSLLLMGILLFCLTTSYLTDAAAINDVCGQTKQPQRCIAIIKSTVSGTERADLLTLGQDIVLTIIGTATDVKKKAANLAVFTKDPKLAAIYSSCENLYAYTLDGLYIASDYLKQRQFNKVRDVAAVARKGVTGCSTAVANNRGLRQPNDDTDVLADALDIVAQKLS